MRLCDVRGRAPDAQQKSLSPRCTVVIGAKGCRFRGTTRIRRILANAASAGAAMNRTTLPGSARSGCRPYTRCRSLRTRSVRQDASPAAR